MADRSEHRRIHIAIAGRPKVSNGARIAAGLVVVALAAVGCGSSSGSSTATTASSATTATGASSTTATGSSSTTATGSSSTTATGTTGKFLSCVVTDTGGINDRSFNASAYQGLQVAAKAIPGASYTFLQSNSTSDYVPNINTLIGRKCGIIVTVGFDMASATQAAAKAHPTQKLAIVDYPPFTPVLKNLLSLSYDTNQSAFLGGYLAAAMSKSGTVGTFGGQDIPTVTIYMDGWAAGVRYYDKLNNAHVKVLGWTPATPRSFVSGSFAGNGLFTNDFTNQGLGEQDAKALMAQGADVIFPVAGAVGLGAAAAVKAAGAGKVMEWVDTDGCISAPQYCSLFITSVTKGIVPSVSKAVEEAAKGAFAGGGYTGTLANDGVGISPFHQFVSKVPAKVVSELATLKAGIISGKISLDPNSYPAG